MGSVKTEVDALVAQAGKVEEAVRAEVSEINDTLEQAIGNFKTSLDTLKNQIQARVGEWKAGESTVDDEPALPK